MSADDLTGAWFGHYAYSATHRVRFIAALADHDGALSGRISEPNVYGTLADHVHAQVHGTRSGSTVHFIKAYDGAADYAHAVTYQGVVSNAGQRIAGQWTIGTAGRGSFEMTRTLPGHEEDIARDVEASLSR